MNLFQSVQLLCELVTSGPDAAGDIVESGDIVIDVNGQEVKITVALNKEEEVGTIN